MPEPPSSERELLDRAEQWAGQTLADLARALGARVPPDLRRAKGWVGQHVERALGATAASRDEPDFVEIGVELKTIPVDVSGSPRESTFVCTIPLDDVADVEWEQSRVRRKLARVLWVPVEADSTIALPRRRIGSPLLWSPDAREEADLRFDWEELAGIIGRGDIEDVTAHVGRYLQVRPKAANSRSRRRGFDRDGAAMATLPRGFYLRTAFTKRLLARHFAASSV